MRVSARSLVAATVLLMVAAGSGVARAASTNVFLGADSEPIAAMSPNEPPDTPLPNHDPGRDSAAGLILIPSTNGASETEPTRFQRWEYDLSGMTATINDFTIWVAAEDFDPNKRIKFSVYVMDCESSCEILTTNSKTLKGNETWAKATLPVKVGEHEFGPGHRLSVMITVLQESEANVLFAYGTQEFDARIHLSAAAPTATTTTTSSTTTTTTSSTTTTTIDATTTTTPSSPTTTVETGAVPFATPSTTAQSEEPPATPDEDIGSRVLRPQVVYLSGVSDTHESSTPPTHVGLKPQEGLMVAFATVVEAFRLYWEVALTLGILMTGLLLVGFSRLETPVKSNNPFDRIRNRR